MAAAVTHGGIGFASCRRALLLALCVFFALIFKASLARASSHDVKGCLLIFDTRSQSATYQKWVGVSDFNFEILYTFSGIQYSAGTLTTNNTGCFSGTISSWSVPEETTVTFRARLHTSRIKEFDDDGSVYYYEFDSKSVGKGEAADLGDFYVSESSTPDYAHGTLLLWRSAREAINAYKSKVAAWKGFPTLGLKYPASDSTPNANRSRISMPFDEKTQYKTFLHEFGHFTSLNEASNISGRNDYCVDYAGCGAAPCDSAPYTMTETATSGCGHSGYSYEETDNALVEGYAEFFADYMLYGNECRGASEGTWMEGLNFDGAHGERNVTYALCDLIDGGIENQTDPWLHAYGTGTNFVELGTGAFSMSIFAASDGTWGYASYGGNDVYRVDLTSAAVTKVATLPFTPERIAVDGAVVCAYADAELACGDASGTTIATNPSAGRYEDLKLADGVAYVLYYQGTSRRVYSAPLDGTWTWTELYFTSCLPELVATDMRSLAVDVASAKLYIAEEHEIMVCDLASCAATISSFSGDAVTYGYKRGDAGETWFSEIRDVSFMASALYVTDDYGVARVDSSGVSKQYVGAGADNVFLNNRHRRALQYTSGASLLFMTDGTRGLIQADFTMPDIDRSNKGSAQKLFAFDDSQPAVREVYCGTDTATLPVKDVVRMFKGQDIITDINTAFGYISGITADDKTGVMQSNWLSLNKNECSFVGGSEELSSTGTSGSTMSSGDASDASCSGTVDEGEDAQTTEAAAATAVTGTGPGKFPRATPASYPQSEILTGK